MPGRTAPWSEARLRRTREAAQLLDRTERLQPSEMVRRLLGVQAQAPRAARLALAARSDGLTDGAVRRAREDERSIVHTWAMRGTLHLVAAEDAGWLIPLVLEPRVAASRRRLAQLGYQGDRADRAAAAVDRMLGRHGPLTRQEIAARLRRSRYPTDDPQVPYHLVWLASAKGGVCYGPERDGRSSLVLVRDWDDAPPATNDREAALGELVVRYLSAHGPSAPEDLAFWSGMRATDARRGWELASRRLREVAGPTGPLWTLRSKPGRAARAGVVRLLPNFDEYLLGWKDRRFVASPGAWRRINRGGGWLHPVVLHDGVAAGLWRAERTPTEYRVSVGRFETLGPATVRAVRVESERYGRFLGLNASVGDGP